MKALHVIDHLSLGGAQRAVRDLIEHRPDDRVFALRSKAFGSAIALPASSVLYAGSSSPAGYPALLPRLLIQLRRRPYDVLHCHLPVSWLFGLLAAKLQGSRGPRLVFHERGGILYRRGSYAALIRRAAQAGKIICVSGYIRDRVKEIGIEGDDLIVMHNAIDLRYFRPDPAARNRFRQSVGIGEEVFLAGFAGRIVPEKGWKTLLDAFAVAAFDGKAHLLIAGIGPDSTRLQKTIHALGLETRITFIGYSEDMSDFYNSLDVCIVPSLIEPFGRVQLEAQACGVPIIASRIPGILETVSEDNAILTAAGDQNALADALVRLESAPQLRIEYEKRGLVNVRKFGLEDYISGLEQLYAGLKA